MSEPEQPEPLDTEALEKALPQLVALTATLADLMRTASDHLLQIELTHREVSRLVKRAAAALNPPPRYDPPPTQAPEYLPPAALMILEAIERHGCTSPRSIEGRTALAAGTVRTHLPTLRTWGFITYDRTDMGGIRITDKGTDKLNLTGL